MRGGRPPDSRRAIADCVVPVSSASSFWESPRARLWSATCCATRAKNHPWSGSTCASLSRSRSKVSACISHLCYDSKHEIQNSSRGGPMRSRLVVHLALGAGALAAMLTLDWPQELVILVLWLFGTPVA